MDLTKTGIQYGSKVEILNDLPKPKTGWKITFLFVGLGLTAALLLSVLVILCAYLSTRKQIFPTDNQIHTTLILQNVSTSTDGSPIRAGQKYGGSSGGSAFDDASTNNVTLTPYFRGIITQTDVVLDWIQCFYSSSSSSKDFFPGAVQGLRGSYARGEPFFLDADEQVNKVQIKVDNVALYSENVVVDNKELVIAVRFFTTKGRSSPDINQAPGDSYTEEYPGYTLGYIAGRSGLYIDQLQFYWYRTTNN